MSQKLRSISETPSLWRDFVWTDYNRGDEKRLCNIMKTYGVHIRRLSFPQKLIQPSPEPRGDVPYVTGATLKLMPISEMMNYCKNLTHLSLPGLDHSHSRSDDLDGQLRQGIQEMKHLEVLSVYCDGSFQPYLNLTIVLKELTIHTMIHLREDIKACENWMRNGFIPPKLNFVLFTGSMDFATVRFREFLQSAWPRWNSQMVTGQYACLKLYISYKAPLSLFQNTPVFQLQLGETAYPPFLHASNVGTDKWLALSDHDDGNRIVRKAKLFPESYQWCTAIHDRDLRRDYQFKQDISISNLTELDLSRCNSDFTHIIINACPQFQRLNLCGNTTLRLEDLQVIATCCCNLQGLNLMEIPMTDIMYISVWEILSGMRLTYLSIDTFSSSRMDDEQEKQLAALFRQCRTLQALQLHAPKAGGWYKLLSHFPSLEYLSIGSSQRSTCVQEILAACNKLRYFRIHFDTFAKFPPLTVHNSNLQELCILSHSTDLDDKFMDSVSAHGGLVHVVLLVNSMTANGIASLIKNSPNLLTCLLGFCKKNKKYFNSLSASLGKKFRHRKLYTSGLSLIQEVKADNILGTGTEWLQNTNLLTLWPPEHFVFSGFLPCSFS